MLTQLKKICTLSMKSSGLMSFLSFSTMTLLVFASIVIITIISVTPIIILGIGQLPEGQRDIIIEPRLDFINTTEISRIGEVIAMPRIRSYFVVKSAKQVTGWFMDFKLEKQQHLGTIAGDEPEGHNYIYAHQEVGLVQNQNVSITIIHNDLFKTIRNAVQNDRLPTSNKSQTLKQIDTILEIPGRVTGQFNVKRVFDTASGKFGIGQVNNYIYLDIQSAFQIMLNQSYTQSQINLNNSPLIQLVNSPHFSLAQFATEATVNLHDRVAVYSNPNYEDTFIELSRYGKELLQKIGLFSVQTHMPIAANLVNLGFVGMFIGVMFKLIICSLFVLSALMMNNMFRMGIERKNFDFALLKVMGANRIFIIANILTGSLKYVALANLFAYPLAYLALQIVTTVFEDFFGYHYDITPTYDSIIGGLIIGVLVPIVSSVAPIWSVIRNDLAQNLNPLRNKTQATKIQVYVEGRQFPTGKVLFGLLASGYGLMIYYLLPRALINQSLGLLLAIFFIILEGLLVGLILLSFSVQYILQRIVAYICLFWVEATDLMLTLKNLSSHRFRNRRTALLYAFSVSFIIFVSVGLQIQLQTIYTQMLKARGSYIMVSGNIDKQFYDKIFHQIDGIQDWAYITASLQSALADRKVNKVLISDKARLFFQSNNIRGVSPNLINTFFYQKVSYYKSDAVSPYDPYSLLYSEKGLMTATIGKYLAQKLGILQGDTRQFLVNIYYPDGLKRISLNYTTIFDKRMGLLYSSLPLHQETGVSFDTFRVLASIPRDQDIPIREIKIKIKNMSEVKQVAQRIRSKNGNMDRVWDYTELKNTIDRIDNILTTVTNILLVIVLAISFFSLLTTTYINILDQTNQIAILLILGYQKSRITRIYIYQSFVLVLNSCLIGLVVGYIVAQMMGLQREIFSELPISVQIRGVPILFVVALISSLLSTYKPLRQIFSNTVSQILNYAK